MNWAYLLRCADGTLYAGWTTNLTNRIATHNAGQGAKYTRGRIPVQLVWAQSFATRSEAMAQEYHLKHITKAEKEALVAAFSPEGLQALMQAD